MSDISKIRNIIIVAHIDHGKSTLADRLIQLGGRVERKSVDRVLDNLEVEKARGITVRSQTARIEYKGIIYNILDTPGHVDFSNEVDKSFAACEGILLIVDATQGIEAQTVAHINSAKARDLTVVPIINKIDLETANPEAVKQDLEKLGIDPTYAVCVSAKTGHGVEKIFDVVRDVVPHPVGDKSSPLQALIIDSWYDQYHGIITLLKIFQGTLETKEEAIVVSTGKAHKITQTGVLLPESSAKDSLSAGEIGYAMLRIRDTSECKVGDTITLAKNPCHDPLPGFAPTVPVVFCGIYPEDPSDLPDLKAALERLQINDSSFTFEPKKANFGMGFHCGFLGILHLEVIQQRLENEFNQQIVITVPSVSYKVVDKKNNLVTISNPSEFPDPVQIKEIQEPWVDATILVPHEYIGNAIKICTAKRGTLISESFSNDRAILVYQIPLSEIVFDFHDNIKLKTKGYGSFSYENLQYRANDLVKVKILINEEESSALSFIVHKDNHYTHSRKTCEILKENIPRQNIKIKIQAAIGAKIIASETIQSYRKDVTAKCYGGDKTRKEKLLKKQKKGKSRMQDQGRVHIPNAAFIAVMKPKSE